MRISDKKKLKDPIKDTETFLKLLHPEGSVFQLAAIGVRKSKSKLWDGFASGSNPIALGWFQNAKSAVATIKDLNTNPEITPRGIYVFLNPVNPSLLSRCNHRLEAGISATSDKDIECLRHFLIDIDPVRPSDTNSSEEEHTLAMEKSREMEETLKQKKWPEPILADTGNGAALVYRLPDLPNDQVNQEIIGKCLVALGHRFDDERVKIDLAVSNPSRLVRLPGTLNRKGDPIPDRPQRRAAIISKPRTLKQVSFKKLRDLVSEYPEEKREPTLASMDSNLATPNHLNVPAYLEKYGRKMVGIKKHGDSTLFILGECVFDAAHRNGESAIGLTSSGEIFYQCFHDSCQGRRWKEARDIIRVCL